MELIGKQEGQNRAANNCPSINREFNPFFYDSLNSQLYRMESQQQQLHCNEHHLPSLINNKNDETKRQITALDLQTTATARQSSRQQTITEASELIGENLVDTTGLEVCRQLFLLQLQQQRQQSHSSRQQQQHCENFIILQNQPQEQQISSPFLPISLPLQTANAAASRADPPSSRITSVSTYSNSHMRMTPATSSTNAVSVIRNFNDSMDRQQQLDLQNALNIYSFWTANAANPNVTENVSSKYALIIKITLFFRSLVLSLHLRFFK